MEQAGSLSLLADLQASTQLSASEEPLYQQEPVTISQFIALFRQRKILLI